MGYLLHSRWASAAHDDVIKWKYFPRYRPFVRRIHRSPVNSLHKGKWRGALTFLWICAWTNSWADNGDAGDLRRHRAYYDVIVMEDVFFYGQGLRDFMLGSCERFSDCVKPVSFCMLTVPTITVYWLYFIMSTFKLAVNEYVFLGTSRLTISHF